MYNTLVDWGISKSIIIGIPLQPIADIAVIYKY